MEGWRCEICGGQPELVQLLWEKRQSSPFHRIETLYTATLYCHGTHTVIEFDDETIPDWFPAPRSLPGPGAG
jgi:hypothetical protein